MCCDTFSEWINPFWIIADPSYWKMSCVNWFKFMKFVTYKNSAIVFKVITFKRGITLNCLHVVHSMSWPWQYLPLTSFWLHLWKYYVGKWHLDHKPNEAYISFIRNIYPAFLEINQIWLRRKHYLIDEV